MADALLVISYIGLILLIGLLSSIISRRLRIPNLLLLILLGMVLGSVTFNGQPIFEFPPIFLTSIAIVTLALVVFDSSSQFKFRQFDTLSASALRLSLVFLLMNMIFLTALTYYIFKPASIFLALIFAAVVSGTDPSATLSMLSNAKSRIFELLKIEAILNTPLIVLIPFLLIDIMEDVGGATVSLLSSHILPFAQQFVVGIGTGILVALIFFRYMKRYYSHILSPMAIVVAAILTYVVAESLGGNGVLGVTTAGIMFGNVYRIKHFRKLHEFGEVFSQMLEILVFVLIGTVIKLPLTAEFLIPASALFLAYILIRLFSVELTINKTYSFKEKLYMALNMPKGIAVAVVVFTLATKSIAGMGFTLDLILLFLIYSVILSTLITSFTKFFTKVDIKVEKEK